MKKASILIVEDNSFLGENYKFLLEKRGYFVNIQDSGDKTIELIEGGLRYDILVTDLCLEGGYDGLDVARASKRKNPEIKTLCLSAYDEDPKGFDGNLKKPFKSIDDLISLIESRLTTP